MAGNPGRVKQEIKESIELRLGSEEPRPESAPSDIAWALAELKKRRGSAFDYRAYYDGRHKQMIALERLRTIFGHLFQDFRVNMCSAVVDAVVDRLQVASFSSPEEDAEAKARELQRDTPAEDFNDAGNDGDAKRDSEGGEDLPHRGRPAENPGQAALARLPGEIRSVTQDARDVWEKNRMDRRAGQIHQEAVAAGDAYVLVWPGSHEEPVIHPQSAHEVAISYDKDRPGTIVKAAKMWSEDLDTTIIRDAGSPPASSSATRDEAHSAERLAEAGQSPSAGKRSAIRLNLYYPDRIEKYAALKSKASEWPEAKAFKPYDADGDDSWWMANEWGVVPIFHFANNADIGEYGRSELTDAVPVQDMANYSVFSLLTGVEFQALPQRYAINIEDPRKNLDGTGKDRRTGEDLFESGADRLWAFTGLPRQDGPDSGEHPPQIGQLAGADLDKVGNVINLAASLMATVTGTPRHHFFLTSEGSATPVSGESQKTADTKLNNKVRDREISFGDVWAEAFELAVRMRRGSRDGTIKLRTNWTDTRPRNEKEQWEVAALKLKNGVPWQQVLEELGYTPEQIQKFKRLKKENASAFGSPSFANGELTMGDVLDEIGVD